MNTKTERNQAAVRELVAIGATNERREDRWGEMKRGWWLDGVWLAPSSQPVEALRLMKG